MRNLLRETFFGKVRSGIRRLTSLRAVEGDHVASVEGRSEGKVWTFLTNHARVLICIARSPKARVRDIAETIGITERATQMIIGDLEEAGYLDRTRTGRRNTYTINPDQPFRHPAEADHDVHGLITLFTGHDEARRSRSAGHHPAAGESTPRDEQ
jgi:hypothetical protein